MTARLRTPGIDRVLLLAVLGLLVLGTLLVWSATSHRDDLTGGDPTAYLRKQLVNADKEAEKPATDEEKPAWMRR